MFLIYFIFYREFSVGLSTDEPPGVKIVGDSKETIGLCGDGKIHYMDNSNAN